jgi:putative FmdB family regulatory protein
MPTYEFECQAKKCGAVSEVVQSIHDEPIKKCPKCKRGKVIKLISLTAKPFVPGHPLDEYMKVKKEAKQIAQRIMKGDERAIADVYGEGMLNGEAPKAAPKPKLLKDVKKGVIKRRDK